MSRTAHIALILSQVPCDSRCRETTWTLVDFSRREVIAFDAPLGGAHGTLRNYSGPRTQRTTNGA